MSDNTDTHIRHATLVIVEVPSDNAWELFSAVAMNLLTRYQL